MRPSKHLASTGHECSSIGKAFRLRAAVAIVARTGRSAILAGQDASAADLAPNGRGRGFAADAIHRLEDGHASVAQRGNRRSRAGREVGVRSVRGNVRRRAAFEAGWDESNHRRRAAAEPHAAAGDGWL